MGWQRTLLTMVGAVLLLCVQQVCAGAFSLPPLVAAAEGAPIDGDSEEERDSQERESEEQDSDDENLGGVAQEFGAQTGSFALGEWADAEFVLTHAHVRGVFRPPERAPA